MNLKSILKAVGFRFPGSGGTTWETQRIYSSVVEMQNAHFRSSDEGTIDYVSEVGDPTGSSLVMAAVRWLGNTLPEAPLLVKEVTQKGDAQEVQNHPMVELLRRPNPYYSGSTLWKAFSLSWIIAGNCYLLKVRNGSGRVVELWYVPHWMLEPRWPRDGSQFISHYAYKVDGQEYRIERDDVIHFRDGIDPNNTRLGLSPLTALYRELYGDVQATRYAARVSKNFGVPPFALMPKPDVNGVEVDVEKIKQGLMRAIGGDNTGKPLVLSSPFDIHEFGAKPNEMAIDSQHTFPEQRFAAVIGIPLAVLGLNGGFQASTYRNAEEATEAAYEGYLIPLHRYMEEELNVQLLPDMDDRPNRFVRHDLSQVRALQDDEDKKYKRLTTAYAGGWLKRSEVRSSTGFPVAPEDEIYFTEPKKEEEPAVLMPPVPQVTGARLRLAKEIKQILEKKGEKDIPSEDEIDEVVEWWKENAPEEAKDLIDASVKEEPRPEAKNINIAYRIGKAGDVPPDTQVQVTVSPNGHGEAN